MTAPINVLLQDKLGFEHPITYRLYRSWDDLEEYQIIGISKARAALRGKRVFNFNDNRKTINEISTMFSKGNLIVDDTYQRRSVWSEKDKIRLIETILLNLIIPELFFLESRHRP